MTLRRRMECPLCDAITLCEWRFNMSPHMCVDHAGWFCLGCMRRIETTSMGQHFMADAVVYDSHGKKGSLYHPDRPAGDRFEEYGTFRRHTILGLSEEVVALSPGRSYLAGGGDVIDVDPLDYGRARCRCGE